MLNIKPEPGEELCDCSSCKRLGHEPMSLRVIRSRIHKRMDTRAGRAQPAEKHSTNEWHPSGTWSRGTGTQTAKDPGTGRLTAEDKTLIHMHRDALSQLVRYVDHRVA